jgi:hypothetical protein
MANIVSFASIIHLVRIKPLRIASVVDQAEVIVERRAGVDTILVVEHVVDVNHDLLGLHPSSHAVQIVACVADTDRKLLIPIGNC